MSTAVLDTYRLETLEAPSGSTGVDLIARDVKVFRVGKFKNSRGIQNDWTADRLQRAVDNFNTLRRTRELADVPVRVDHTKSMRDVVGYFHELRFDGTFLVADILFTKKSAFDDFNAGHFRGRSLEIGQYETNAEKLYDDVVQGLAFVDIPAVEGLHQRASGEDDMATKDDKGTATDTGQPSGTPAEQPAAPTTAPASPPATPPAQPETPATPPADPNPPTVPAPKEATTPVENHGRAAATVHTFRVNGVEVTDPAVAQAHIDSLEKFRNDMRGTVRTSFVDDLVSSGKILGPQKEQFAAHVATLNDEQFAAFRTMYDGMPAHNLFGRHDTTTDPSVSAAQDEADALAIANEVIANFRRANKSDEFIKGTDAWKLVEASQRATAK